MQSCLKTFRISKAKVSLYSSDYILTPLLRQNSHWWKWPGWIPSSEHYLIFTYTQTCTRYHWHLVCSTHPTFRCYGPSEKPPCRGRAGDQTGLAHWSWVSWGQVPPGWGSVCILWCPPSPENTLRFPWARKVPLSSTCPCLGNQHPLEPVGFVPNLTFHRSLCTKEVFKFPGMVFQAGLKSGHFGQNLYSQLSAQLCWGGTDLLHPGETPHNAGWRRLRRGEVSMPMPLQRCTRSLSKSCRQRGDGGLALEAPHLQRKNRSRATRQFCDQGRLLWSPIKLFQ